MRRFPTQSDLALYILKNATRESEDYHIRALIASARSKFFKIKLDEARDFYFCGWYLYKPGNFTVKPKYQVFCKTFEEYLVVRAIKPDNVNAKIIYMPRKVTAKI